MLIGKMYVDPNQWLNNVTGNDEVMLLTTATDIKRVWGEALSEAAKYSANTARRRVSLSGDDR